MLNELVKLFKAVYEKHGDKIILDFYKPKEGLYLRVNKDKSKEWLYINKDIKNSPLYEWLKSADYYSSINMQKSVDPKKKIHSNNYLSMFLKSETVFGGIDKNALSSIDIKDRIEDYFNILENSETKSANNIYKEFLGLSPDKKDFTSIRKNKKFLLDNYEDIIEEIKSKKHECGKYIKIFFEASLDEYKEEYMQYMSTRIFNKNEYNIYIDGEIFGLADDNITSSSNKPFLKLRNMKCEVPYRIKFNDAFIHRKFFDWLKSQLVRVGYIPLDFTFQSHMKKYNELISADYYYLDTIIKNDNVIITDFDYISSFEQSLNLKIEEVLKLRTAKDKDKGKVSSKCVATLRELEHIVDIVYFKGKLINAYYSKVSMKGISMINYNILLLYWKSFYDCFRKNKPEALKKILPKISLDIARDCILNNELARATKLYNLIMTMMQYFGGNIKMAKELTELVNIVKSKIASNESVNCESDEEFYFLSGQLTYFILSKNKTKNKTLYTLYPILCARDGQELKKKIILILNRYQYAISASNYYFNRAFSMIMTFNSEKNMREMEGVFLAGFLANNVFYESYKSKGEIDYENEEQSIWSDWN